MSTCSGFPRGASARRVHAPIDLDVGVRRRSKHNKFRVDQEIRAAFRSLPDPDAAAALAEVLAVVWERSSLLRTSAVCTDHAGAWGGLSLDSVRALRNLAEFHSDFVRPPGAWEGARGSSHQVVHSLAQHLLARYPVPQFLSSVWGGQQCALGAQARRWFVRHGAGVRFRDLDLGWNMTRSIERVFLRSPDHLLVWPAMRRAEVLALGGSPALAQRICATRLGFQFDNGAFWRSVCQFFVRVEAQLDLSQVGPIVDFLQNIRHEEVEADPIEGGPPAAPPQPDFSIRGRSLASVMRLVHGWHRALGRSQLGRFTWAPSPFRGWVFHRPTGDDTPPRVWEFAELTSSGQLKAEGVALQHCVGTYSSSCRYGRSYIWSLRQRRKGRIVPVVTIEIDAAQRAIVQARGLRNRRVSAQELEWMKGWAEREALRIVRLD